MIESGDALPTPHVAVAELRLRSIIELAADAIISVDSQYRITLFNAAAERIFGYERSEVLGQSLDILLPVASRLHHRDRLEDFRQGPTDSRRMGERGQIWGRRRSGELFPAEASISKMELGGDAHFTAVLRDVTEQHRAERLRDELLQREREARETAELAGRRLTFLADAAAILHSSLEYERTFDAMLRLIVPELALFAIIDTVEDSGRIRRMHVLHGDPAKQSLADQLHAYPYHKSRYLTRHTIATGEPELITAVSDELLVAAADDAEHLQLLRELAPTSYIVVPLRVRERVVGAMLLARGEGSPPYTHADAELALGLTQHASSALDNAHLYEQSRRAVRARDDVLAIVSHDLRTPLSVISMCATAVLADEEANLERTRDRMQTIRDSLDWADRVIRDLLDVSAIEAGGLSLTCRLEDPVLLVSREVHRLKPLADERSITLRAELPEHLPNLNVDAQRLMQALGNLVGNALKFTPGGGEIIVGAVEEDESVRFFVSDTGPGVPSEDVARVFDRFWTMQRTSRTRGTGMGLAIVRGVAEAHGGSAWVISEPGRGATFNIRIPISAGSISNER